MALYGPFFLTKEWDKRAKTHYEQKKRDFLCRIKRKPYLCTRFPQKGGRVRANSAVGSERLPYKQKVGGSNPSSPTKQVNKSTDGAARAKGETRHVTSLQLAESRRTKAKPTGQQVNKPE